ncbi:amidohydrolase family protein [Thermofilum pendens]|uniref:Amidohydrolase n=1 Tax=Thermofilum pendens (strain DSM 2475 / Hrk 5) TaxID=368408 RepID=A1RZ32_THEPD|nr:amidohydrolase [Thermofilum pendens]ABL78462.1 amidohydrolase [Thermofilum pendens Hrk 5]
MGVVEVGELFAGGRVLERARLVMPGVSEDFYFESAVSPGFSDAHAHPQVVDVGEGGRWRNSYEWIEGRRLRVNEASLRRDAETSAELAEVALLLSLLDGVTLVALTGSLEGNIEAVRRLKVAPRTVLLPTVMRGEGWSLPESIYVKYVKNLSMWDGYYSLGFFVHSLRMADRSMLRASKRMAERLGVPFALHLSEGVDEADELVEALEGDTRGVIAVHCFEGAEKCRRHGLRVVHCPTSNLYLYGRTLRGLEYFDSLGSDWPLVTGTLLKTYGDAVAVHGPSYRLLERATLGGYLLLGFKPEGDLAAFDEPLSRVVRGEARPSHVFIGGRLLVREGVIAGYELGRDDVERVKRERVKRAFEKHGV